MHNSAPIPQDRLHGRYHTPFNYTVMPSKADESQRESHQITLHQAATYTSKTAEILLRHKPEVKVSNVTGQFSSITNFIRNFFADFFANRLGRQLSGEYDMLHTLVHGFSKRMDVEQDKLATLQAQHSALVQKQQSPAEPQIQAGENLPIRPESDDDVHALGREIAQVMRALKSQERRISSLEHGFTGVQAALHKTDAKIVLHNLAIEQRELQAEINSVKAEYKTAKKELKVLAGVRDKTERVATALAKELQNNAALKRKTEALGFAAKPKKLIVSEKRIAVLKEHMESLAYVEKMQMLSPTSIEQKLEPLMKRLVELRQKVQSNADNIKLLKAGEILTETKESLYGSARVSISAATTADTKNKDVQRLHEMESTISNLAYKAMVIQVA